MLFALLSLSSVVGGELDTMWDRSSGSCQPPLQRRSRARQPGAAGSLLTLLAGGAWSWPSLSGPWRQLLESNVRFPLHRRRTHAASGLVEGPCPAVTRKTEWTECGCRMWNDCAVQDAHWLVLRLKLNLTIRLRKFCILTKRFEIKWPYLGIYSTVAALLAMANIARSIAEWYITPTGRRMNW